MKRKIAWLLALVCLVSALTGCGGKKELEPRAFVDELLSGAKFTDSLDQLDDSIVPLLYGVDAADYTSAIVYAGTGATAEEIAVFTARDDAAADRLLTAARTRVDDRIESFKNYGPAAAMSLENAIVEKSGKYVIVVVCSDSEGAAKIADKYI